MRKQTLEQQLAALKEAGVALCSGITIEDLLLSCDRGDFQQSRFELLLVVIGGEVEREPYERISDDVWQFDTECIEDHGSYVAIAERVRDLADGTFPICEAADYVNIEEGKAWLSFRVADETHKWDLRVDGDWVDTDVFTRIDELLRRQGDKRLIHYDLGGQDCLILAGDAGQLQRLRATTLPMRSSSSTRSGGRWSVSFLS